MFNSRNGQMWLTITYKFRNQSNNHHGSSSCLSSSFLLFTLMSWSGWGTHVDIAVPPGGNGGLPEWSELKFNPLGLYNLRRRLGALKREAGVFMRYKDRFLQSDIAWFTAGLHNDGQHITSRDTYHPLFLTAREHTGTGEPANKLRNKLRDAVRDHVFDTVSLVMLI